MKVQICVNKLKSQMIKNDMSNSSDIVFQGRTEDISKVIVIGDPAVGKAILLTKHVRI